MTSGGLVHEITQARAPEFVAGGLKPSLFFPHRFFAVPKGGPDGMLLAHALVGPTDPSELWEIVLYAGDGVLDGIPRDLFFDDELMWHQQQFGLVGQVATASLVLRDGTLYALTYVSDLAQRISRHREHKTRVEKRLKGWAHMLQHAVASFAVARGCRELRSATAEAARRHTDPTRRPERELFDRVYDRALTARFSASRDGSWWRVSAADLRARMVRPVPIAWRPATARIICVCHDIERHLGHDGIDTDAGGAMETVARAALPRMLDVEASLGIRATYHVLGRMLGEVREQIEAVGHACAFHSFDHLIPKRRVRPPWPAVRRVARRWLRPTVPYDDQLAQCRQVDYRIKGYRPPQSRIGPGQSDRHLAFYNFEWLASAPASIGCRAPELDRAIVKIPIQFDDFPLYRRDVTYDVWEARALDAIARHDVAVFSLHDCYADRWLPRYRAFLEKAARLGEFRTLNDVSAGVILASGQ